MAAIWTEGQLQARTGDAVGLEPVILIMQIRDFLPAERFCSLPNMIDMSQ